MLNKAKGNLSFKTPQPYRVKVHYPVDNHDTWLDVQGYPVVIRGFEEYEFFVHRSINGFESGWRISEKITGLCFPVRCDGRTRQDAVNKTIEGITEVGKDKFAKVLANLVKSQV